MPHTPGPWKVSTTIVEGGEYPGIYRSDAVGQWGKPPIAVLRQDYPDREDNARLIAAAPELLSVLRDVRIYLRKRLDWVSGPDEESADLYLSICQAVDKAYCGQ